MESESWWDLRWWWGDFIFVDGEIKSTITHLAWFVAWQKPSADLRLCPTNPEDDEALCMDCSAASQSAELWPSLVFPKIWFILRGFALRKHQDSYYLHIYCLTGGSPVSLRSCWCRSYIRKDFLVVDSLGSEVKSCHSHTVHSLQHSPLNGGFWFQALQFSDVCQSPPPQHVVVHTIFIHVLIYLLWYCALLLFGFAWRHVCHVLLSHILSVRRFLVEDLEGQNVVTLIGTEEI